MTPVTRDGSALTEEEIPEVYRQLKEVTVNLARTNHLVIPVEFDFYEFGKIEVNAVLDTGSEVCFLNRTILLDHAPNLFNKLTPCPIVFHGLAGTTFTVDGMIQLDCKVAGKMVTQHFVVASIVENALLGLDFMTRYNVNWDWLKGTIRYDSYVFLSSKQQCCLSVEEVVIPPKSLMVIPTYIVGEEVTTGMVLVTKYHSATIPQEMMVSDTVNTVRDNYVNIEVGNASEEYLVIPKDAAIGEWTLLEIGDILTIIDISPAPKEKMNIQYNAIDIEKDVSSWEKEDVQALIEERLPKDLVPLVEWVYGVSNRDRLEIVNLLLEYHDVFSLSGTPLGRTDMVEHKIHTGDAQPIKQQPRRVPLHQEEVVKTEIERMISQDVIRPSESPWASPVVIVKKKDGSFRFCVDYRKLNGVTEKDAFPLPRVEENLDALSGNTWFTSLDLASGYWQVMMAEEDRPKTAFATKYGLFEFNTMPFGLCNAPATFQRLMERVLRGLQWRSCVLYLDDVVVFGKDFQEHLDRVKEVFQCLREAGLKLKPKKCQLFKLSVAFLGHIVDCYGIGTDPEKVEKIKNWAVPQNVHDIRVFTGLTSYYRSFVKDYAKVAAPLHELTKKNVEFVWEERHEEAFQALKDALSEQIQLSYPVKNGGYFYLDTDASNVAIGAALHQEQEGIEKLLRFASRCLSPAERNYCTTRKELLAVVYFLDYFKHYLLGDKVHVVVRTDHGCLRWLKNMKNPSGQVARWLEKLAAYDWEIQHRAGRSHNNADALSRSPCDGRCPQCLKILYQLEPELKDKSKIVINYNKVTKSNKKRTPIDRNKKRKEQDKENWMKLPGYWGATEIIKATAEDPVLKVLIKWSGNPRPDPSVVAQASNELKFYFRVWNSWKVDEKGLVWYKWYNKTEETYTWKLIVPQAFRGMIMRLLHDIPSAGHLGEKRTISSLRQAPIYWMNCYQDIRLYCRTCESCFRSKYRSKAFRRPMQSFTAGEPMERMAIDVAGEFCESRSGNKWILVCMDYFTKYVTIMPIPNHQAKTLAKHLVKEVFCKIGIPLRLHSDQGTDFLSHLFMEVCQVFQIHKTRTSPWRPQSDGMVERFNRTVGSMMKQYVNDTQSDWDEYLPLCSLAYNSTIHSSTGYSPNFLMFGRDFRLPLELVVPVPDFESDEETGDEDTFVQNLKNTLRTVYGAVREKLQAATAYQKSYYDKRSRHQEFKVGDSVWLYNPIRKKGRTPKLDMMWQGPYGIVNLIGEVLAEIRSGKRNKSRIVHVDKLALTRRPIHFKWIKELPKKREAKGSDEAF